MNHYEVLQVSPHASREAIRTAYKKLMQRCHPDKFPGDAEAAARATLVVQAYVALSDPTQRAYYDLQIAQRTARKTRPAWAVRAPAQIAQSQPLPKKGAVLKWYPAALMGMLLLCTALLVGLATYRPLHIPKVSGRADVAAPGLTDTPQHPLLGAPGAGAQKPAPRLLTTTLFQSEQTVVLRGADSLSAQTRLLSIPALLVTVGSFDSATFLQYFNAHRDIIGLQLLEKLEQADGEKLTGPGAERYLKTFILDALGDISHSDRFENYPATELESPAHYGVTDVFLPAHFSLK